MHVCASMVQFGFRHNSRIEFEMRVLFVRHGETDWNKEARLQGQLDVPLNDAGRKEAASAGREIRHRLDGEEQQQRVHIISSDSLRALETATIIGKELGGSCTPEKTALLRERGLGEFEGRLWHDVAKLVPNYDALAEPKFITVLDELLKNRSAGESREQFIDRVGNCALQLQNEIRNDSIHNVFIIVTHGLTLRCLIASLFFDIGKGWPNLEIKNCSVSEARITDGRITSLVSLNETHHLPQKRTPDRYAMLKKAKL